MVDKLLSFDAATLKLATFSLRNLIKERAFLDQFLRRGGLDALQEVIKRATGNTLAYSLLSMQNLMDLEERGWEGLDDGFAARIVEIIGQLRVRLFIYHIQLTSLLLPNSHRTPHQHLPPRHGPPPAPLPRRPSPLLRRHSLHRLVPLQSSITSPSRRIRFRSRLERD